jgi:DNA-directed RNA polymerase subunit H (RpoH/RPB5)
MSIETKELVYLEQRLQDRIKWLNDNCIYRNTFQFRACENKEVFLSAHYLFCKIEKLSNGCELLTFELVDYQLIKSKKPKIHIEDVVVKSIIVFDNVDLAFGSRDKEVALFDKFKSFNYLTKSRLPKLQTQDIAFTENLKTLVLATYQDYQYKQSSIFSKILTNIKKLFTK